MHPKAGAEVIKKAYYALVQKYHPDHVAPGKKAWAAEKMRALNRAFAVLADPLKRADYDRQCPQAQPLLTDRHATAKATAGPGDWCTVHRGVRAVARCDHCGRLLCEDCAHENGVLTLCLRCLSAGDATRRFAEGQQYLEKGADHEAANAFREVVRLTPDDAAGHYNLGVALLRLRISDEAASSLERAAELQPMDPEIHVAHARALAAKGDLEEAIKAYRRGLSMAPERLEAAFELGMLLARVKSYREAYAAFDEVVKRDPADARALLMQAKTLVRLKREREASPLVRRALTMNPNLAPELRDLPLGFRVRHVLRRVWPKL